MTVSRIDHVGITTSDLDRSLGFYVDLLGLRLVSRKTLSSPEIAALLGLETVEIDDADLDSGDGRIIEVFRYLQPAGRRVEHRSWDHPTTHIALTVDDMAAVSARLKAAGVEVISTRLLKTHAPGTPWDGVQCLYVRDPDGVIVELVQRPGG
jgi:catechol 2,3-dioxygenase-like lactoylglutathione lyase family enzyme